MHVLAALAIALSTVVVPTGDPPPTEKVTIDLVTINGNGCGSIGSGTIYVSPDNTAFVISSNGNLVRAAAGPQATPSDARRNCQYNLRVNTPPGYTYAIGKAGYQGFAMMETGSTASFRATYSFQGLGSIRDNVYRFRGPLFEDWERTDVAEPLVFLPCGQRRNLNATYEMRAGLGTSDPTKTSYLYRDASSTVIDLHWQRCP